MFLNENEFQKIVEEYKEYITANALVSTFDFDTWHQHQYGCTLQGIDVEPKLKFEVHQDISNK
jgi:hypothetical protein